MNNLLQDGEPADSIGIAQVATSSYLQSMRTVGIKTLKDKLSEYVRLAAAGETILITDRDRIVAELAPPEQTRAERVPDALLAEAVREGIVTPAALPPGPPPEVPGVAPLAEILADLDRDRSER